MADDPVTVTSSRGSNLGPGCRMVRFKLAGPGDYDASGDGAKFDLTSYFKNRIDSVTFGAVDAKADALVKIDYVNDDMTDLDGGYLKFSWNPAAAVTSAAVFADVANGTDLSGYVFYCTVIGE